MKSRGRDIPHPAIGRARRMQVPVTTTQAAVMIEAVEPHAQLIIIDEIGTASEAEAAGTIAERGVRVPIGTATATVENPGVLRIPLLADLVGEVQAMSL